MAFPLDTRSGRTLASITALLALGASQTRSQQEQEQAAIPRKAEPEALAAAGFHPLFDGKSLDGWKKAGGTGQFKAENGAIVGFGKNIRGNTFLCTENTYGDFIFIFEFRFVDPAGNSGCQFRSSRRNGKGRVFGYQCELDNNKNRSFTAGIYDESRRGWLFPGRFTEKDKKTAELFSEQGQNLFLWDDWNTIVIRCEGKRIETWLNGASRARFEDTSEEHFTAEGFIALQVHGGKSSHVEWRNLFLKKL